MPARAFSNRCLASNQILEFVVYEDKGFVEATLLNDSQSHKTIFASAEE
jgi:hypothetical protein